MLFMLENIPYELQKNVYAAVVWWIVLCISANIFWSIVFFKFAVSLLILCLDDLSIVKNGVLKFLTITVLVFIYSFDSVSFCIVYVGAWFGA